MKLKALAACLLTVVALPAFSQTNLGELLDKGARKAMKEDYLAAFPAQFAYVWPNKQGEADLLYKPDGTISGKEKHYRSSSISPATGTWTVDENGKWCASKKFSEWNTSFNGCFYGFIAGEDIYFSPSDTDRSAALFKGTLKKVAAN